MLLVTVREGVRVAVVNEGMVAVAPGEFLGNLSQAKFLNRNAIPIPYPPIALNIILNIFSQRFYVFRFHVIYYALNVKLKVPCS